MRHYVFGYINIRIEPTPSRSAQSSFWTPRSETFPCCCLLVVVRVTRYDRLDGVWRFLSNTRYRVYCGGAEVRSRGQAGDAAWPLEADNSPQGPRHRHWVPGHIPAMGAGASGCWDWEWILDSAEWSEERQQVWAGGGNSIKKLLRWL